jgi:hypothetical protein
MRDTLAKPVTLEIGLGDNTPLKEAVEFISDRYDITLLVATQAFEAEGTTDVEAQPVKLPKLIGVKLSTVLRLLAAQIHGTYLIRPDFVEILPIKRARPESWQEKRDLPPTVSAEFTQCSLAEALRELSDLSGITIVLDSRASDKAKAGVTATLRNVPIDTAVLILSDMAFLRPVPLDNVLYVTTKENAEELNAWHDKRYKKVNESENASSPAGT